MRGEVDTGRLEAFSDGVFAIAITLLILQVGIDTEGGSLAYRLAEQWPSYVSFVVSFAIIGILWLNHHQMFRDIRVADHGLFVLNLALLLVVCFIPFPTEVIGDELASDNYDDRRTAAVFYGLTFVGATLAFNALWLWAARRRRLIEPDVPQPFVDARTRRYLLGIPAYPVATLVAIWSPYGALTLYGVITLFYLLPLGRLDRLLVRELRKAESAPDGEAEEEIAPSQEHR
jgi:uncharacterized membrane protein